MPLDFEYSSITVTLSTTNEEIRFFVLQILILNT